MERYGGSVKCPVTIDIKRIQTVFICVYSRCNLFSRPTLDDLNLLKKELAQMQQLTDTLLKEKENEIKQLVREQNELKTRLEK